MDKRGTLITLSNECSRENKHGNLFQLVEKIISDEKEVDRNELKVLTNISYGKSGKVHYHIFINRVIHIDIEKEWTYGQSSVTDLTTADRCRKAIRYLSV